MSDTLFALLSEPNRMARFWGNVDQVSVDGCWPWKRALNGSGYGVVRVGSAGISYTCMAHRAALMLAQQRPLGDDLVVDHRCSNRTCCNPAHLEEVDATENVRRSSKYRAGDGRVVRRGSYTIRQRGKRHMVIWREYLDNGNVRQCGKTFLNASEAAEWASTLVDVPTSEPI